MFDTIINFLYKTRLLVYVLRDYQKYSGFTTISHTTFSAIFFRSLQCHRTKIHKHLFGAYIARLAVEIILGVNQFYKFTQANVGLAESIISSTVISY